MNNKKKWIVWLAVFFSASFAIYQLYPFILFKIMEWQKVFNIQLSASMKDISENKVQAGATLVFISFLYGFFHAVGPGHGKFILTSYLSLEQTKLRQAVKLSLASSFVQGLVAVTLVSIIVVVFSLSRSYFNLALKWVERGSFTIMIVFGLYWCYQAFKANRQQARKLVIKSATVLQNSFQKIPLVRTSYNVHGHHIHDENCSCGHKHLPTPKEMQQAQDWKAQLMIILSIGVRPCSGAILVLFFAYTLNLYWWGVLSTFVMSFGTGLTLSLFATLVLLARKKALRLSYWYLTASTNRQFALALKLVAGVAFIILGFSLLHGSFIEVNQGGFLKR